MPGDGTIDWPGFLRQLGNAGYDGVLMGELGRSTRSGDEIGGVIDDYTNRMTAFLRAASSVDQGVQADAESRR